MVYIPLLPNIFAGNVKLYKPPRISVPELAPPTDVAAL